MSDGQYDRVAPRAREIAPTLEPSEDDIGSAYLDPLRKLGSRAAERLEQEGFKEDWKGVSVTDPRTWKNRLDEVRDEHLYLYLLRDCIDTGLVFWQAHYGFDPDERDEFAEHIEEAQGASDSPKNLLKTWVWLQEVDAPTELEHRQETLDIVVHQGGN